jgi:hypothetical protein
MTHLRKIMLEEMQPRTSSVALQPNRRRCLKSLQTCGNCCNALQMKTARMIRAQLSRSRERRLAVDRILAPIGPPRNRSGP